MIKPSKDGKMLWLIPPEGSKEQELEFPLIYSHTCPKCGNLVQALFMTDKRIEPRPWEEIITKVLDAGNKYKRIIPGRHKNFRSRYSVTTLGRGSSISAELIRFAEHFERRDNVVDSPICDYVAISSTIPEYKIYDMLLACFINPLRYKVVDKDYPDIKAKLSNKYGGYNQYAFQDAVGNGPECIFISRTAYVWFLQDVMAKYYVPYPNPVSV